MHPSLEEEGEEVVGVEDLRALPCLVEVEVGEVGQVQHSAVGVEEEAAQRRSADSEEHSRQESLMQRATLKPEPCSQTSAAVQSNLCPSLCCPRSQAASGCPSSAYATSCSASLAASRAS